MLETALLFREAFNRFGKIEPDFLNVAPTSEDWNNASSLSICLKVFYEVTILFSAHVYSANISTNQVNMEDSVGSSGSTLSSQSSFTSRRKGLTAFLEESSQHDVVRTDLEQYLSADVHPIRKGSGIDLNDSSFDVLGWWKFHGPMYPIVAVIARDILAIPASSVASESVFSTSGRVVDKFRSSMLPETIEALICTQDWIRSALKNEGYGLGSTSLQTLLEAMEELESDDDDARSHITIAIRAAIKRLASCLNNKKLKIFETDPFDYESIINTLKDCSALFYTFETPQEQPIFDEFMDEIEVRAAHNVLEACAQTDTMEKVIFTSSVTAVIWGEDHKSTTADKELSERNWSDVKPGNP
ncbi:uncharacterized protein LOC113291208 [Papaver somniferum]|uniref:uncharacterized protein LOC113291208 n=1 Tax=Papaver somniferum TaxID=3469 RepID=UPI000E6FA424|nr:uncharacterized protein LOC113291208 [Papaver somniferum]